MKPLGEGCFPYRHVFPVGAESGHRCYCGKVRKEPARDIVQAQEEAWKEINDRERRGLIK